MTLRRISRRLGIQTSFLDDQKRIVRAKDETLRALLESMTGRPARNERDLAALDAASAFRTLSGVVAPVTSAWDGRLRTVSFWLPSESSERSAVRARVTGEGIEVEQEWKAGRLEPRRRRTAAGVVFDQFVIDWKIDLAPGYYRLTVEHAASSAESLLVSVPPAATGYGSERKWGVFSPIYALRGSVDRACGTLTELAQVLRVVADQGGSFVGTLPFLALDRTIDRTGDLSPYGASTRLFWDELYLDTDELAARFGAAVAEPSTQAPGDTVDYSRAYGRQVRALTAIHEAFRAGGGGFAGAIDAETERFLSEESDLQAYCEFRARRGLLSAEAHAFAQALMHDKLLSLKREAQSGRSAGLYLDFPVGVRWDGFDAERYGGAFLAGTTLGAPPDSQYKEGQDWGLAPFHPRGVLDEDCGYLRSSLANHFRYSSLLRIDHVMGLSHAYVIPKGFDASSGAYVNYASDAFYAILGVETARAAAAVVGEDLGTVSDSVHGRMDRHAVQRMWVFELECARAPAQAMGSIPRGLAAVNTHDMPTWTAFARARGAALDPWRRFLGVGARGGERALLFAIIEALARSPARNVLITLEDLWGETRPQNTPNTTSEANWSVRHPFSIDHWARLGEVAELFARVDRQRCASREVA